MIERRISLKMMPFEIEELSIGEFLSRTSFEAFEDIPLYPRLGFAFGVFEQNIVFVPEWAA